MSVMKMRPYEESKADVRGRRSHPIRYPIASHHRGFGSPHSLHLFNDIIVKVNQVVAAQLHALPALNPQQTP